MDLQQLRSYGGFYRDTVLVRRPDSAIGGTVFSHIFVIFRDRPGLLICFLHMSTRSIDWRNKNCVSRLSRFLCNGTIRGICPKNG